MGEGGEVARTEPHTRGGSELLVGQPNFRDLAGAVTGAAPRLKGRTVYRSGEIVGLSDLDRERLGNLGLRTVVDLRSDAEVAGRGRDEAPEGAQIVRIPITEADGLQELISERFASGRFDPPGDDLMAGVYRSLVGQWMPAFRSFVDVLVDGRLPVVVHCTHGKDRAGIASALVLAALGVDRESIEADFLESNARRRVETEQRMLQLRELVADRCPGGSPPSIEWMRGLFEVDRRYLDVAWEEIDLRYGSPSGMVEDGLGLTPGRLARLRDRLLI
ncbi:MAG: tyrosine-protein phosphatase [Microthrixaceae bacterium]